jgi:hypothetical protein
MGRQDYYQIPKKVACWCGDQKDGSFVGLEYYQKVRYAVIENDRLATSFQPLNLWFHYRNLGQLQGI